jgi:hypothetical protein
MDGKYQSALALATASEGWVEKGFWKEEVNDYLAIPLVLFVAK